MNYRNVMASNCDKLISVGSETITLFLFLPPLLLLAYVAGSAAVTLGLLCQGSYARSNLVR
jgi:hypothetical protein